MSTLPTACSSYQPLPSSPTPVATPPASTPTPTPTPTPSPGESPTVTITPTGLSPLEITIPVGRRVMFVNNDTRNHDLVGRIDPAHPNCPEIVIAGFLTPGQRRETGVFTSARTCDYHDHTALGVPAFSGRIVIR
ncbi:MAG: hypothetical protein ACRD2N_12215 [Vicinamibacterales bacterium]